MRKLVLLILVAVIAAVVVGPLVSGGKARQAVNNLTDYINQSPAYEAQVTSYEKKWLGATAHIEVRIPLLTPLTAQGQSPTFELVFDINHGPVLFAEQWQTGWYSGRVRLPADADGWLRKALTVQGEGPFWQAQFHTRLDATTEFADRTLAADLAWAEGQVELGEYEGSGTLSAQGELHYKGHWPRLFISDQSGHVELSGINLRADLNLGGNHSLYYPPGKAELSVDTISGEENGQPATLSGLLLRSATRYNDEATLADMDIAVQLADFQGFEEQVEDLVLDLSMERVSLAFLQQVGQSDRGGSSMMGNGSPPAMDIQMLDVIMSELLPSGPRISLNNLAFTAPEGRFVMDAFLAVAPEAAQVANPMALPQYLTAEAKVTLDKELALQLAKKSARENLENQQVGSPEPMTQTQMREAVDEQAQMQLNMLLIQGMLQEAGEQYKTTLRLEDGKVLINGQSMPLQF